MTPATPDSPHVDEPPSHARSRRPRVPAKAFGWLFVVLGVVAFWASFLEAVATTAWDGQAIFSFILAVIPPVCAVLIPGALLLRHPDAGSRARTLLFGTLVFASVTFFRAIEGSLQATFKQLTPAPEALEWFVSSALVYTSLVSLIGLFGLLYIGLGLSKARNYAFTRNAIIAGWVIVVTAVVAILGRLWTLTGVDVADPTLTPQVWAYIGSIIVIGILTILAWSYVARVLTRCALSGEEPELGWYLGAAGTCLIVATFAIVAWSTFVAVSNQTLNDVLVYIRQTMYAIGHLALLAGFVLGLPSLERVVWADEDRGSRHDDAEAAA